MKTSTFARSIAIFLLVLSAIQNSRGAQFVVKSEEAAPPIVLQYDAAEKTGFDWARLDALPYYALPTEDGATAIRAARYLREAIRRMTGKEPDVSSKNDLSRGFVLALLKNAPADIQNDKAVIAALKNDGKDNYNANEAFFIRSEVGRVLIVANTPDGLMNGVVELLESADYEVLGMGPNWIYVPDHKTKPLVFDIARGGRPGFYIRNLWATSAQQYGVGTLMEVHDEADETVLDSYARWRVGTRMEGQSMADFPGHALYPYHKSVVAKVKETGSTKGFLTPQTTLGLAADRPEASKKNLDALWIDTDDDKVWGSDGAKWIEQNPNGMGFSLDHSVPFVREIILEDLKKRATEHFQKDPDAPMIFGLDPEDGVHPIEYTDDKNWYPDYLKKEGVKFGAPYVLNGFKGLDQPKEIWDGMAFSDTMFGFDNWLLREYDQWIDALPTADRKTASGRDKKAILRLSHYSYGFHDVPPNFNIDPRIRVMIAGYPKHRGLGKWKNFASNDDIAQAFQVMLPREPSGDYWITSIAYYGDYTIDGIGGSHLPQALASQIHDKYKVGFRAINDETDFNFGKKGLEYYLYAKMLWNPKLSAQELNVLRDRWLQRAFGAGWETMRDYYNFMAPENYKINAPNTWAKAIRFIQSADEKIPDGSMEQKRLDDLKQFWYFYYLLDKGQAKPDSAAFKEFVWKGQMSYATAMQMVTKRFFNTANAVEAAGAPLNTGRAHYTHEETQEWWNEILENWKVAPVADFTDATLADGSAARDVDLNDLVEIKKFRGENVLPDAPFLYHAQSYSNPIRFAKVAKAGEEIGFQIFWPFAENANYRARNVFYGISRWNKQQKKWDELADKTTASVASQLVKDKDNAEFQLATLRYQVPQPGTYRIEVMNAGDYSKLTSLAFDFSTGQYSRVADQTYLGNFEGLTQSPAFFYIPRGTKSLDFEIWDSNGGKTLTLYNSLPADGAPPTRKVDVSARGTHNIPLEENETGTVAMYSSNGFAFPYLYSAPNLWAKSTSALLVPREIAKADKLAPIE